MRICALRLSRDEVRQAGRFFRLAHSRRQMRPDPFQPHDAAHAHLMKTDVPRHPRAGQVRLDRRISKPADV